MPALRRLLRSPLVHFLALGGLLLAAGAAFDTGPPNDPIVVTDAEIAVLRAEHRRFHQRDPDARETGQLVRSWIDQEMKVREARRLGLADDDLLIRRRLAEKMKVLLPDDDEGAIPPSDLYAHALELGLDRNDAIIRGRLVQRLEMGWAREYGPVRASEPELRAYLEANRERFERPGAARVSHVFVDGPGARARAAQIHSELRRSDAVAEVAPTAGDPFLAGHHLPMRSERRLEETLGAAAVELAFAAPAGQWVGPVESAWGTHLLWVHDRREKRLPPVDHVRQQLLRGLAEERREERIRRATAELRDAYPVEIRVEDPLLRARLADLARPTEDAAAEDAAEDQWARLETER